MGVYEADTLPVDDDTFLNGGTPPTPTPAPASAPAPEPEDEFAANAIEPDSVVKPAPVKAPEPKLEKEPELESDFTPETKEVSLQPSAKFEEQMQKNAKVAAELEQEEAGSQIGTGEAFGDPSFRKPHNSLANELPHTSGMTPSQAMVPDGMLNDNRVKLNDGDEEESKPTEVMIPSQAMAESFSGKPISAPLSEDDSEFDENEDEDEEDPELDDEDIPVVVGPVISSAGMESLTEEQAENPTVKIEAQTMTMRAKIDDDEEEPNEKVETTSEEQPVVQEEAPVKEEAPTKEETPVKEEKPVEEPTVAAPATTTTSTNDVAPHAKSTHPAAFIIIGLVLLAVIGLVVAAIIAMNNKAPEEKPAEQQAEITKSVFFLPNTKGEYSLYNSDGEQISNELVNGKDGAPAFNGKKYAVVYKDEKVGLMNDEGKLIVDFGKYDSIYTIGDYFYANKDEKTDILVGEDVVSDVIILTKHESGSLASLEDSKVSIYNDHGKKIFSISCTKNKQGKCTDEKPVLGGVDTDNNLLSFHYNNTSYVLDANTGKELAKASTASPYILQDYLNGTYFLVNNGNGYDYIIMKDNKAVTTEKTCTLISKRTLGEKDTIFCTTTDGIYALHDDLSFGIKVNELDQMAISADTYAKIINGTIVFYKNSKEVAKSPNYKDNHATRSFPTWEASGSEYYLVQTKCTPRCEGRNSSTYFEFFSADGEKLFGKEFETAMSYDLETGLARVMNENNNWYLINKNGKAVSEDYDSFDESLTNLNGWYYRAKRDDKYYLVDSAGKEVASDVSLDCIYFNKAIYCINGDGTGVYKNNEEVLRLTKTDKAYLHDGYIEVINAEYQEYNYYTLSGKLFYSFSTESKEE